MRCTLLANVVDTMVLSTLLAKYEGDGAPAYHPAMMFKVTIYAYSQKIYSSRSIARELKTDTAFMFLSGLQSPDSRTISFLRWARWCAPRFIYGGGKVLCLFRCGGIGAHYLWWLCQDTGRNNWPWSGLRCKISPESEQKVAEGGDSLQKITILWSGSKWLVIGLWQRRFLDSLK